MIENELIICLSLHWLHSIEIKSKKKSQHTIQSRELEVLVPTFWMDGCVAVDDAYWVALGVLSSNNVETAFLEPMGDDKELVCATANCHPSTPAILVPPVLLVVPPMLVVRPLVPMPLLSSRKGRSPLFVSVRHHTLRHGYHQPDF